MKPWRLLDSGSMPPSLNMAVDQAILALHAEGKAPPTLRFYGWQPPAVSLGYFQKPPGLDLTALRGLGFEVVRRPTGGKAVLHWHDLTYALIGGPEAGLPVGVAQAYRLIGEGLRQGLSLLGVEVQWGGTPKKRLHPDLCLLRGLAGALLHEGKKFMASAQAWQGEALLQHGSLVLKPQTGVLLKLWGNGQGVSQDLRLRLEEQVTSLEEIMGYPPQDREVKSALAQGVSQALGVRLKPGELSPEEAALAEKLSRRQEEDNQWARKI